MNIVLRSATACTFAILVLLTSHTTLAQDIEHTIPALFSDLSYAEASKQAGVENKILLIDFTAEWCGPCKQMDRTSWVDESVVQWVATNAIAVQVDVDHDSATAMKFKIDSMPTIILERNAKVLDRASGYKTAEELLDWLNGVLEGKTILGQLLEKDQANDKVDIQLKLELASTHLGSGNFDEAEELYVWLWKHMLEHNPGYVGVRVSFMMMNVESLIRSNPPSKGAFTEIRDNAWDDYSDTSSRHDLLRDWVVLNEMLGDEDRTLAWFDGIKAQPNASQIMTPVRANVIEMLKSRKRWVDLGKFERDPLQTMKSQVKMMEMYPAEMKEQLGDYLDQQFRTEGALFHAACLAAERDEMAWQLADYVLEIQDSPEAYLAMLEAVIEVAVPRATHRDWIDKASKSDDWDPKIARRFEQIWAEHQNLTDETGNGQSGG